MLIKLDTLRERLHGVVLNKGEQGHNIEGLQKELDSLSDSYDEFVNFSKKLSNLKIRSDWNYVEPNSINDILNEMDPSRPKGQIKEIDLEDSSKRVEAAFLASLCGCMLGKPLEAMFTGHEIRKALEEESDPIQKVTNENILVLNKLIKDDGTIDLIEDSNISKSETIDILNKKLDEVLEKQLNKWLDQKIRLYLDKYFKNKNL